MGIAFSFVHYAAMCEQKQMKNEEKRSVAQKGKREISHRIVELTRH